MSPRVFFEGPYWLYFYASDHKEPVHVHVSRDDKEVKIWLETFEVAFNRKFSQKEIRDIIRIIERRRQEIEDKWNDFFIK
ncbi:MAG: DUF4160 domain-containing protein [Calditrichaceae bacterium]|nr:DUF4160 domain-containing protein [Calditrichaceae bacterium]